jgi:hypothetical protein
MRKRRAVEVSRLPLQKILGIDLTVIARDERLQRGAKLGREVSTADAIDRVASRCQIGRTEGMERV